MRTHLTEKRWRRLQRSLPVAGPRLLGRTTFEEAPLRSRRIERAGGNVPLIISP